MKFIFGLPEHFSNEDFPDLAGAGQIGVLRSDEELQKQWRNMLGTGYFMEMSELSKLNYDTYGFAPGIDYVPDLDAVGGDVVADFVERAQLQAAELNVMDGVNRLGGSLERRDEINLALDDGVDLLTAVEQFGDEEQKMRVRQLIRTGQITS